ncbi:dihydroorotate dehydrogenase electron transfer subunit [Latilactobacillus fuchuensis]|uniref:dihydroorotate dehydrogenase electron transfer subunit n=1 Tax=Latilactobacillus fuchuensis TaxID=164393 RepID=UPI0020C7FFB9|nr:dihydroorotate dehydrogenase electron transfer subunit [Latilactobacillus fuchuensis]MCP8856854.1 dihydroorotate dehydrogenase electron transfer subunit [Latilactobacillus fuchuensis]
MSVESTLTIQHQTQIAPNIYELCLAGSLAEQPVTPGQFVDIKIPSDALLLRRPFGVAKVDAQQKTMTLLYRVVGEGTTILSQAPVGTELSVLGPLGSGYPIAQLQPGQKALIIGGGTGIPPLYELSRQLVAKGVQVQHLFGFATQSAIFYQSEFEALGPTAYATNDGSYGYQGHIGLLLDAQFADALTTYDAIYACGPKGLLMAVDNRFANHPNAYISLEERMACGIGACYACVTKLRSNPEVQLKICDDGPVFKTNEVLI